jgi:hypothetical protein
MTSAAFIAARLDSCSLGREDRLAFCSWFLERQTIVSSTKDFTDRELEMLEAWLRRTSNQAILSNVAFWRAARDAEQVSLEELISSTVSDDPTRYSLKEIKDLEKQFRFETRGIDSRQFTIWLTEREELLKPVRVPVARAGRLESGVNL